MTVKIFSLLAIPKALKFSFIVPLLLVTKNNLWNVSQNMVFWNMGIY